MSKQLSLYNFISDSGTSKRRRLEDEYELYDENRLGLTESGDS